MLLCHTTNILILIHINFSPETIYFLGMIMSPALRKFINKDLYEFNRLQVLRSLRAQHENNKPKLNNLLQTFPELKNDKLDYMNFNEDEKYNYIYNQQRSYHDLYHNDPQASKFVIGLIIFKFGGTNPNTNISPSVLLDGVSYELTDPRGLFLLLPSMLSEDIFDIKAGYEGVWR